jgi:glycosyltransferase involved in cell wall biosynthesis
MPIEIPVKISVIMPVYNAEKYLAEAIQSILNQSYRDFELLILNDGSKDSSAQIARGFESDPRVKLIDRKDNWGLVRTLNDGLERSMGEFIARMDADDISLPDRFMKQINLMEQSPEIGICGTLFQYINKDTIIHLPEKHDDIKLSSLSYNPFGHPTVMMRASVLREKKIKYLEKFFLAEDYEIWTRILDVSRGVNIPEVLLHYRIHPQQISSQSPEQENVADQVRILQIQKVMPKLSSKEKEIFLKIIHRKSLTLREATVGHMLLRKFSHMARVKNFADEAAILKFCKQFHAFKIYHGRLKPFIIRGYQLAKRLNP